MLKKQNSPNPLFNFNQIFTLYNICIMLSLWYYNICIDLDFFDFPTNNKKKYEK